MTSIPESAATRVQAELAQLSTLLSANLPGHAEAVSLALEPGSDGLVQLWSVIGWSSALADAGFEMPTHEHARTYAKQKLAEYRSWGEGIELTMRSLPKLFRVVEGDSSGVGFSFADETGRPYDPPLRMVSTDDQAVVDVYDSSIRWIANMLVPLAYSGWHRTFVALDPTPKLDEQPFEWISPATRRVDEQLWSLPPSPDAEEPASEGTIYAHKTFERLVAWLHGLPKMKTLELGGLPGERLELSAKPEDIDSKEWAETDELRVFAHPEEGFSYRVGMIAGKPALISVGPYVTTLAFDPRDRKFFEALVAEREWGGNAGRRS